MYITIRLRAGVGKVRPAGQIRPAKTFCPARDVAFSTHAGYTSCKNVNCFLNSNFLNGPRTTGLDASQCVNGSTRRKNYRCIKTLRSENLFR
jgi:hypothetical protein